MTAPGPRLRSTTRAGRRSSGVTTTRTQSGPGGGVSSRSGGALSSLVVRLVRAGDAAVRTISSWARRANHVITPLGWVVLLGAPVVLALGGVLGWMELLVLGWTMAVLGAIALLFLIGRPRIAIELDLPHHRVSVGEPATGRIVGRNPHVSRSLATTVEVPIGASLVEFALPGIAGGSDYAVDVDLPTLRRGIVPVGPVRTIRGDPIGLVRRELVWAEQEELIVHPRIVAAPSASTGLVHDLEGVATRELSVSDLAFHALRDYQPGDERRYIHWKSSAKTGRYMVRQFEQSRRSHLVVAMSLAPEDYRDDDEFELAVSVTGSLGVRAIRDARSVSVVTGQHGAPSTPSRQLHGIRSLAAHRSDRLLDELARIDRVDQAPGLRQLARSVADQLSQVSLAFLVCGGTVPGLQLRAAANSFPSEVRVIAVVCDPDVEPGLRPVGGLDVLHVGLLDDLRQALARTAAVT